MESEKELQTALVVPDLNPVLQQSDSQFYFILFVAVILFAGFLIGACVMGIFMWHRVGKLTVVRYKGSLMNVPAFLWHVKERDEEERNQRQNDQLARPTWFSAAAAGSAAGASSTAAGSTAGAASKLAGSAAGAAPKAAGSAAGAASKPAGSAAGAAPKAAGSAAGAVSKAAGSAAGAARLLEALLALHPRLLEALLALAPRLLEALRALVLRS